MIWSSRSLVPPTLTIALIVVVLAVAIILFVANVTIASAQQQPPPQPLTSQLAGAQNQAVLFQNTEDGIRLNVPQGWVIEDLNNTGPVFSEESTRGYGILAQLCLSEREQQQRQGGAAPGNASNNNSCQGVQEEIIHIVRYPNLDSGIQMANNASGGTSSALTTGASFNNNNSTTANTVATTMENILSYHLQKLQEVGYSNIRIVNNADMTVNTTVAQSNQTIAILPAKFVEMIYTTASAPDETRRGYFILTATNATAPNLGTTKGYSVFYEGNNVSAETRSSNSSEPTALPEPVRLVFDSFELVTAAAAATAATTETDPLSVEIISSDTEGTAPATFEFEAEISGGMEPYTIRWDFGDGSDEEENDEEVEHTFNEDGSYNVRLTATDSGGQSATDNIEITVEEAPVEEEQPLEEEGDDLGSDVSDMDGIVDDFIDDLFGRLGLE